MSLPSYNVNTDKRVKLLLNDTPVSSSTAQSQYARPLNIKGTGITASSNDTLGTFDVNFPSSTANTIANVGTGAGTIYRDTTSNVYNLKTLLAGSGISLTNNTNDVTITSSGSSGSVSPVSGVKWGVVMGGSPVASTLGSGLCTNWNATALTSGNVSNGIDTDGAYHSLNTTSTSQTNAEINSSNATVFRGDLSFKVWTKIKIPNVANNRWFVGVTDTIALPQNTFNFLNNANGFGVRYDTTTDTTLQLINNNNAASQTVTNTAITPVNNTVYNIYIEYTSAPQMKLIINGTTFTKTTAIPSSTTTLGWLQRMQNSTGSVRNQFVYYIYCEQSG